MYFFLLNLLYEYKLQILFSLNKCGHLYVLFITALQGGDVTDSSWAVLTLSAQDVCPCSCVQLPAALSQLLCAVSGWSITRAHPLRWATFQMKPYTTHYNALFWDTDKTDALYLPVEFRWSTFL